MRYRASNGVLPAVVLTEAEAREHFESAPHVDGEFGGRFVTYARGEMGHLLAVAATVYEPLVCEPEQAA